MTGTLRPLQLRSSRRRPGPISRRPRLDNCRGMGPGFRRGERILIGLSQPGEAAIRTATIQVRRGEGAVLSETVEAFLEAWRSGESDGDVFTFSSPTQLFSVLTPKRWALIERLQALGPSSLRGLARALERDVKRVHEDAAALLDWGLVHRTENRQAGSGLRGDPRRLRSERGSLVDLKGVENLILDLAVRCFQYLDANRLEANHLVIG